MNVVAICSMKGGVGKTTTAVNLSYLAAAGGRRVLLWDLDPQAASTFAFRAQPRVAGFDPQSFENGDALAEAVRPTDHRGLDLLPADFAYRKMDRQLGRLGNPGRTMEDLFRRLGRDYDVVFLDCPPGFSHLTEGVIAAADLVLVPTIPTVLSLRAVSRMIRWADHAEARSDMALFFSMVDRRKALHRRACEWAAASSGVSSGLFMSGRVPYASMVEQVTVQRTPLAALAPRDPATVAFADVWAELDVRLRRRAEGGLVAPDRWVLMQRAVESLIERVERFEEPETGTGSADEIRMLASVARGARAGSASAPGTQGAPGLPDDDRPERDSVLIHRFDTPAGALEEAGYLLELREESGHFTLVVKPAEGGGNGNGHGKHGHADAQIDASWARHILAGTMSPLAALERRSGQASLGLLQDLRMLVVGQRLQRMESRRAQVVRESNPFAVEIFSSTP